MHKDKIKHLEETIIHKKMVLEACWKMSRYLDSVGREKEAIEILRRAAVHDNSKLGDEEIEAFSTIVNDKSCLGNAEKQLDEVKLNIIKIHWKNNSHHPEHFEHKEDMTEMDIIEMVCDWYARSMEYGNDLIEFVKKRQSERFHFPEKMFEKIIEYCEVFN